MYDLGIEDCELINEDADKLTTKSDKRQKNVPILLSLAKPKAWQRLDLPAHLCHSPK